MKKLILTMLVLPLMVLGQIPAPLPDTYVNDHANVLTKDQITLLNQRLNAIETKSSVEIAIVLVDKLPAGMEMDEFTLQIGRQWRVGNANNGLVYAVSINERKQRLEVADHLQGTITDAQAYEIQNVVKPFYKQKDYAGGINKLLDEIERLVDPVIIEQNQLDAAEKEKRRQKSDHYLWLIIPIGGISILAWIFFSVRKRRKQREEKQRWDEAAERFRLMNLRNDRDREKQRRLDRMEHFIKNRTLSDRSNIYPIYPPKKSSKPLPEEIKPKKREDDSPPYIPSPSYPSYPSRSDDSPSYTPSTPSGNEWGGGSGGDSNGWSGGGSSNDW